MSPSDQSCTSSSSLAIAALVSISAKTTAHKIDPCHSEASIVLGFSEALSSKMVRLAPENTRSGSEDMLAAEWISAEEALSSA